MAMFEGKMKTVSELDQFIADDMNSANSSRRQKRRSLVLVCCVFVVVVVVLLLLPMAMIIAQNRNEIHRLQGQVQVLRSDLDFFKKYFPNDLMFDVHAFDQEFDNTEAKLNATNALVDNYYDENDENIDNSYYDDIDAEIDDDTIETDRSKRDLSPSSEKKLFEKKKASLKSDLEDNKAMGMTKSRQKRKQRPNQSLELVSGENGPRVEHRKHPPILAHFHGNGDGLSHYSDFTSGLYTDWTPSNWVEDFGFSHHFHFDPNHGITVKHTGIYFVYAQIYYHDQHDLNGFRVKKNHIPFMQCTTTTFSINTTKMSKKSNSCFTGAIQHLQEGDTVTIEDLGRARHTFHEMAKSFFGFFRLSDSRPSATSSVPTSPSPKRRKNL